MNGHQRPNGQRPNGPAPQWSQHAMAHYYSISYDTSADPHALNCATPTRRYCAETHRVYNEPTSTPCVYVRAVAYSAPISASMRNSKAITSASQKVMSLSRVYYLLVKLLLLHRRTNKRLKSIKLKNTITGSKHRKTV